MQVFTIFQFLVFIFFLVKMFPYGSQMGETSVVIYINNLKLASEGKIVNGTSITVMDQSLQVKIHFPP